MEPSNEKAHHERCEKLSQEILKEDQTIHYFFHTLQQIGCQLPKPLFSCNSCSTQTLTQDFSGGYAPNYNKSDTILGKIILCQDKILDKEQLRSIMVHELIHLFDDCRANMDLSNCEHHACTEIRASRLSGECNVKQELQRGNFNLLGQYQECVKRRATLSVSCNENCWNYNNETKTEFTNDEKTASAKQYVEKVWTRCYNDVEPFIKRP